MGAFKAYDIRGLYPSEINETLAHTVGRAAVVFLKAKTIIVGRDCRIHSLALKKSLVYGITDQGCDVLDTGYCSTPMCYFAARTHHALMITASHNPKEYNGIKVTKKPVEPIGEHNGLKELEKIALKKEFPEPKKRGEAKEIDILPDYVTFVRDLVGNDYRKLRVLIDCGNGMAGYVVPKLFEGLPIHYDLLYGEMDGTFPNHMPNPVIPENTKELQEKVLKGKYDLGIAYDADCDRVFFIDEKGERVRPEHALILFALHTLKEGQSVVYTVNSSKIVQDAMKENGFKAHPSPIGHTEIPLMMRKHDSILGAEITGHFYFKSFDYADSGDIAALFMLFVLSKTGQPLSELTAPYKRYATSEETNFKVTDKDAALKRVEEMYHDAKITKIDGISVDAGEYWFNLRASKTENLIRLNAEATSKKILDEAMEKLASLLT